jgi:hypothetical protein
MSKTQSKIGITLNKDVRPVPSISYTAPACSTDVPDGYYQNVCGEGTYAGYLIDSICNCTRTDVHTFTITNTTVNLWEIDYLGGNMRPSIVFQNSTTLVINLSADPSVSTTPLYCASGITDSVFEITASHDYAYKTIKVVAIQC